MISALLAPIWRYLVAAGLLFALVSGALFAARREGRQMERAEALRRTLDSRNAQDRAAADSPRDRDGLVDRLRDGGF